MRVNDSWFRKLFLVVLGWVLIGGTSLKASQTLSLTWDPSPERGLEGYNLYYGETGGGVTNLMTVGKTTTAPVPGLEEGKTYFFFVTAFNLNGSQGTPSNVVLYQVPNLAEGPKLESIADQLIEQGGTVSLQAKAAGGDPALGETVFSLKSDLESGATIDPRTGIFTWSATTQPSTNTFVIEVSQTGMAPSSDEIAFSVVVVAEGSIEGGGLTSNAQPPRLSIQTGRSAAGGPTLSIQWSSRVGINYRVEYKDAADAKTWIPLASVVADSTTGVYEDVSENPSSWGFYRVVSE